MTDLENYLKKKYGAVRDTSELKKKKKVKKKKKEVGVRIVDEDAVWQKNIEEADEGEEDAPAVVEDEELTRAKRKELLRQRTILAIGEEGGGWVDVTPAERKLGSPPRKVRHDTPDMSPGRPARVKHDTPEEQDMSPPRRGGRHDSPDMSPPRARTRHDSPDISPPRKRERSPGARHDSPDMSPPRRRHDSEEPKGDSSSPRGKPEQEDFSPPRRRARHDSPDISPPRRLVEPNAGDLSPPRRTARHDSPAVRRAEDLSPPRKKDSRGKEKTKDLSPPRRRARHDSPSRPAKQEKEDLSPPRRGVRHDSPDISPPRRPAKHEAEDLSPPRRRARHDSPVSPSRRKPEDLSPQRRSARHDSPDEMERRRDEADLSPPRRRSRHDSENIPSPRRRTRQEPEDLSPPRNRASSSMRDLSPPRRRASSPQPDRGRGGLKTGRELQQEIEEKRKQEAKRLRELDPEVSGRGAETVYRDKYGRKLSREELMKQQQGPAKPVQKPLEWGAGLAQKREALKRQQEFEAEKAKPFARSKDDLDDVFKNRIRWGDPMAHLVKQSDEELLEDFSKNEKMKESGFNVPQAIPAHSWLKRRLPAVPNRYNIRPGRHWDGIDRSNGFEEKLFKAQNEKKAQQDLAYKWSVEDM